MVSFTYKINILSVFRIVSTANSEYLEGDEMAEFFVELPVSLKNTIISEVV